MKNKATAITILLLVFGLAVGWVMNVVSLFSTSFSPITGEAVLRVVGIFVPPIGGIMGWL